MPKQKNTRPTSIYWLFDMRPETVAKVGPRGWPFYCGKTVDDPKQRLRGHRFDAKKSPMRSVSVRLLEIGKYVRLEIEEVVPPDGDWRAREEFWIYSLRTLYPGCANIANGGQGCPGYVHTPEWRARQSELRKGHPTSEETRRKIGAALKGRKYSPETIAKMRKAGRNSSAETRAKISATLTGRKHTPEACANMSAAIKTRYESTEARAKISATSRALWKLPEYRAKLFAARKGQKRSLEFCAKMREIALRRYETRTP